MKAKELRSLSEAELEQKTRSLKDELYKLNFDKQAGRVDKPHRFLLCRKDIARINTILRERRK